MTDLDSPGSVLIPRSISVTVHSGDWSKPALYVIGDLARIFTDVIAHRPRTLVVYQLDPQIPIALER
jgi:hypothetical protein